MPRSLWPKTKFVDSNTVSEQLAHILSEIDEAAEAGEMLSDDHFHHTEPLSALASLPLFRELGDIQASIETLWGILDRIYGEGFSEKMIRSWIEEKNRVRGYYVEGEARVESGKGELFVLAYLSRHFMVVSAESPSAAARMVPANGTLEAVRRKFSNDSMIPVEWCLFCDAAILADVNGRVDPSFPVPDQLVDPDLRIPFGENVACLECATSRGFASK